jgi:cation diffusion facilitator CzcD-associated flavoprotein CzcO
MHASAHQVVVIGAGPSGIASALALRDHGVAPLVLDRADRVASSWRGRYARLRLNTWRDFSHLPDRPFPAGTPKFPTRDQMIQHVASHAHEDGIELQLGTEVNTIDRENGGWAVRTAGGDFRVPHVVVATGYVNEPQIPEWKGRDAFERRLVHSCEYRDPEPFRGEDVLVVGPGCSGMEIAHDLAEGGAGRVWLSARTPPNIVLREGPGGTPGDVIATALLHVPVRIGDAVARFARRMGVGDLSEYGCRCRKRASSRACAGSASPRRSSMRR